METSLIIQAYSRDPIHQYEMEDFTVQQEQKNSVCGDMIVIYLKINEIDDQKTTDHRPQTTEPNLVGKYDGKKYIIAEYSHAWAPQIFTIAAASLLAEEIEGKDIEEVLIRDYAYMKGLWFDVSPRRKRSAVSALLAVRNAIHIWKNDAVVDGYEDLL